LLKRGRTTSRTIAIVDAGPLCAVADARDPAHAASLAVLERSDLRFVISALALAEALYSIERQAGPRVEARFIRSIARFDVEAPTPDDFIRMAQLVEQYADFTLGGTDASVVALAERLGAKRS
jgi:predicted nucleic acid-binding protein